MMIMSHAALLFNSNHLVCFPLQLQQVNTTSMINIIAPRQRSILSIQNSASGHTDHPTNLVIDSTKERIHKALQLSVSPNLNHVPTVYPPTLDLYKSRLSMVDTLQRLGLTRHFSVEIKAVLDDTYRCWAERDEKIFMDVVTCALAFRLLRTGGYQVSSDLLAEIINEEAFESEDDVAAAVAVYDASQILYEEELSSGEPILKSSQNFLRGILSTHHHLPNRRSLSKFTHKQVDNALRYPFSTCLDYINTRRNIESYSVDDDTRNLKTTYSSSNITNKDYLKLAVEDFNACQSIFREELKGLERWVVENKLDQLKFARQKTAYCYFSSAASFPSPELADVRISMAKDGILATVVDDFFDVAGTMDELANLIHCVQKWDIDVQNDCCSEHVRIIFLAIKDTVRWIANAAFKWQERDVTSHLIQIWLDLMNSMWREAIWTTDAYVPTITEYMENGYVSFALGVVVLPSLYCAGPKLSEEIVESSEYHHLFELMSTQGRLTNDIHSFKREVKQGKLNVVALHLSNRERGINVEEEVVKEMKMIMQKKRIEMMKLVMEENGSIVPTPCRYIFWEICKSLDIFYKTDDGYSGDALFDVVNDVVYNPLVLANGSED